MKRKEKKLGQQLSYQQPIHFWLEQSKEEPWAPSSKTAWMAGATFANTVEFVYSFLLNLF